MIRESDEECLALIATIRKRGGTPDGGIVAWWREYERLLDNLEARIEERSPAILRELGDARLALAKAKEEVIYLSDEVARLNGVIGPLEGELKAAQLAYQQGFQDGKKETLGRLTLGKLKSALRPLVDRDLAHNGTGWNQSLGYWMCGLFVDAINGAMGFPAEPHVEEAVEEALETRDTAYCPCGTKADHERQEARNARESAKVDRLVLDRSPTEDCPCGTESCREAWRELREAKAEEAPTEAETRAYESARLDLREGMPNFRDIIREEVAKATAESSREIAVQLISLAERLAAVELHEAANQPGEPSFRLRTVLREEVRKEVEQELAPVCRAITEVEESIFKASAEIGEARRFAGNIREEVAAEVERQLGEWQEAKASPEIRTWLDNVQHELDKLRVALEAEAS